MSSKEDKIMFKKYIEMKKKYLNLKSQIGGMQPGATSWQISKRDKFQEFKEILQAKTKKYHDEWESLIIQKK